MDKPISEYLGDGAYITYDGYGYMLTANHHDPDEATDKVYLEPPVYQNLLRFFERITAMENPVTPNSKECNCGVCVVCYLKHKTENLVPNLGDPKAAINDFLASPGTVPGNKQITKECKQCHNMFRTYYADLDLCNECFNG